MKKIFAIISGEPNSINSEIIAKSWKKNNTYYKKNVFVIGSYLLIKKQLQNIGIKIPLEKIKTVNNFKTKNVLQILDVPLKFKNSFKIERKINRAYILKCLNLAHNLAIKKKIKGFINASIDKKIFNKRFLGVTEYLASKNKLITKNSEVMCIYNKNLSVIPLTTHVDIKKVASKINSFLIEKKTITVNNFFKKYLKRKPKIAILGLNPHNSENKLNSIENLVIKPAVKKLIKQKINISGPYSADTSFIETQRSQFDVIIGMYHDQVLGPLTALYGYDAINITLGLNYIRISPDHGTAVDLIGLNKANPLSLINSIKFLVNFNDKA